ncbi:amidase family protein [Aliisedimentitalea scapharcae]|uniref:Amidase family protein n=1 Tax=Aliisedimentitalea scapharcae TaxID=1524259 RepID=A0ABZ2XNM9_9RHOB
MLLEISARKPFHCEPCRQPSEENSNTPHHGVVLIAAGAGIFSLVKAEGLPPYPLAEPDYSSKRQLDFSAFEAALSGLDPNRIAVMDTLVAEVTLLELQVLMNNGQFSAEELVTYYVQRIRAYDMDKLNSVLELNPEALAFARDLDVERAAGTVRSPMHGIPVLFKDNIATGEGMHTTAGAWAMRDWQPSRDAFLVSQLREAGAIVLGKTNLSEWANYMDVDMPNGFSVLGGQTRNPYGPYGTLGSSSGSAVAAAANFAAVTVGTETQGSIILPAKINGVVGLKTSRGLVSRDHILPLVDWMDVPGPIGRTVSDVAVMLSAMTDEDEKDLVTFDAVEVAGTDYTQFLVAENAVGKKLGIVVQDNAFIDQMIADFELGEDSASQFRQAMIQSNDKVRMQATPFVDIGIELVEVSAAAMPSTPDLSAFIDYGFRSALDAFLTDLSDEAPVRSLAEIVDINSADSDNRAPYGQGYLESAMKSPLTPDEYAAQVAESMSVADDLGSLFEAYALDVLLSDSQIYAATGFPALTVPAGYGEDGQPEGIILIGDFLGEDNLIIIGYAYEQATQARQMPDLDKTISEIDSMVNR